MFWYLLPCLLAFLRCASAAFPPKRLGVWQPAEVHADRPSIVNCSWKSFEQNIDHFGNTRGTFKQRYCVYDKYHRDATHGGFAALSGTPGPLFFYTGNESPLEVYINNTGLMWEMGKDLGALLVWVEHRYEPLSHPKVCGSDSPKQCLAYCTTAQALADYVAVIEHINTDARMPVVAFGGSYGGMLAGWLRMKYPHVVDGAIAASAPIWMFATTVQQHTLDLPAQAISRGLSAAGGASDRCFNNLQVAWPLLEQVGLAEKGLELLTKTLNTCEPLRSARDFTNWAQAPYFELAEGNYPFPSTYITGAVGPGFNPLPPWAMKVACSYIDEDFGIQVTAGSARNVSYHAQLGKSGSSAAAVRVSVEWMSAVGNGAGLSVDDIKSSGVLDFAVAIANAAGVWYNVTKDQKCWNISATIEAKSTLQYGAQASKSAETKYTEGSFMESITDDANAECPACPPCANCPPCGVSRCNRSETRQCNYKHNLSKTFSWEGVCANDDIFQVMAQGLGRDIFWPPSVNSRNYTVESIAGPHMLKEGYAAMYDAKDLYGAPVTSDPWSGWATAYYGGRNLSHHKNIVWSNGLLDPWSGMGVYPPHGGPDGPMVQNISDDGSQFALLLDLGAHHLDLMFSDPRDPPCAPKARAIEKQWLVAWCQEAYNRAEHPSHPSNAVETVIIVLSCVALGVATLAALIFMRKRRNRLAAAHGTMGDSLEPGA